jgi:protein-S-isoprenylcysteine O-methyltransferase Ste14
MVWLKTLIFTVVVPGTVAVYIPYRLLTVGADGLSVEWGGIRYAAVIFMILGATIYLWCAWDFAAAGKGTPAPIDPPKELVVRGLYRYTRNPMYVGVLLLVFGQAWLFASRRVLIYAGVVFAFFHLFVVFYEEPALRRMFGESYRQYCARVPRWMPRFAPRHSTSDNPS